MSFTVLCSVCDTNYEQPEKPPSVCPGCGDAVPYIRRSRFYGVLVEGPNDELRVLLPKRGDELIADLWPDGIPATPEMLALLAPMVTT